MSDLTSYAIGHLTVIGIDKRFERVVERLQKDEYRVAWRIDHARDTARRERYAFSDYLSMYEKAIRGH